MRCKGELAIRFLRVKMWAEVVMLAWFVEIAVSGACDKEATAGEAGLIASFEMGFFFFFWKRNEASWLVKTSRGGGEDGDQEIRTGRGRVSAA